MMKSLIFSSVGILASFASFFSIALSIYFYRVQSRASEESKRHSALLQQQLETSIQLANDLAKRLSTRFKGNFPEYLTAVESLLKDAKRSVKIMAMVSSHGSFTDHYACEGIKSVLNTSIKKKLESDKTFEALLIYGSAKSFEKLEQHYKELPESEWRDLCDKPIEGGRIKEFFARVFFLDESSFSRLTPLQYHRGRFAEHMKVCQECYLGFERRYYDERLPMYCWLIDDREAIFAISTEDNGGFYMGAGIYTADPALITSLKAMFSHFRASSKPFESDSGRGSYRKFTEELSATLSS